MQKHYNTGFTLSELVVVIVIIALLAVFMMPTFGRRSLSSGGSVSYFGDGQTDRRR
jgi:prepilin-type N-terminal cleavage/methylation domain-containing protein